jgi:hypothetical protein
MGATGIRIHFADGMTLSYPCASVSEANRVRRVLQAFLLAHPDASRDRAVALARHAQQSAGEGSAAIIASFEAPQGAETTRKRGGERGGGER